MKYLRSLCLLLLSFISTSLSANSITAYNNQTAYVTKNFVFHDGALAQGFVRLNNGFTVAPHSCVNMDVLFTISGGIDLRETSTIRMLKDLEFDSNVTLTTGGNIDGRGHTLILNGDFTIPANKVLHFNGDTILDVQGHVLIIGENAEIFVDTNVTLTIANATIKTTRNSPTFPALRCGAFNSKLALDNVVLEPADTFLFLGGRFFIHNDVAITGTSAFVYNSPVPSFITKNSCLYFDHAVTFSMAPATFTDAPYSLKNTYTNNNFIRMADETSVLYLDGNTLQTTNTGWRVTTGTVSFDDRVQIKTDPTLTMTALEPIASLRYGSEMDAIAWHPSGNYIAICSPTLQIYYFDGAAFTLVAQDGGTGAQVLNWSPDGRYLAAGWPGWGGLFGLRILRFDGASLTLVKNISGDSGGTPCWSPDGKYLAFTINSGNTLQVHRFDGSSLEYITQLGVNALNFLSWSMDGRHLCGGSANVPTLSVYDFEGTSLQLVTNYDVGSIFSMSDGPWSPDGRYLGCATDLNTLRVLRFDGTSLMASDSYPVTGAWQTVWSADGRYIALAADTSQFGFIPKVMVFSFDGKSLYLIPGSVMALTDSSAFMEWLRFSPNGKYLAVSYSNFDAGYGVLKIYAVDYVQTTTPQSLTNSMVFGDSAKGDAYDAHLRLQPGASVNLTGKMLYDNVD